MNKENIKKDNKSLKGYRYKPDYSRIIGKKRSSIIAKIPDVASETPIAVGAITSIANKFISFISGETEEV
jgi:hypothetical protein